MKNADDDEDITDGSKRDSNNTDKDDRYLLSFWYNSKNQTSQMLIFNESDLPSGDRGPKYQSEDWPYFTFITFVKHCRYLYLPKKRVK